MFMVLLESVWGQGGNERQLKAPGAPTVPCYPCRSFGTGGERTHRSRKPSQSLLLAHREEREAPCFPANMYPPSLCALRGHPGN